MKRSHLTAEELRQHKNQVAKDWYHANRERALAGQALYKAANPERIAALTEKHKAILKARYAAKRAALGLPVQVQRPRLVEAELDRMPRAEAIALIEARIADLKSTNAEHAAFRRFKRLLKKYR